MNEWDVQEENSEMKVNIITPTPHESNIEKLLKWQSDRHVSGTYYSDEYLAEIRKIIKSKSPSIRVTAS